MSSYRAIICGQEVEVTVLDPVAVDRTKQNFIACGSGAVDAVGSHMEPSYPEEHSPDSMRHSISMEVDMEL